MIVQQLINSSAESGSSDGITLARDLEVERSITRPLLNPKLVARSNWLASKKANRNVPHLARAKYAPARNLKEEISAKRRDGHWPAHFEFKTFDRTVTLDLPMTMVNDIKADDLEAEVSPDFPLSLLGRISRKQSRGKTDNVRREFMIKRFERSISSRPAS